MNYRRLEELREKTKVSSERLGEVIGISGPGYSKMIKERTCRVDYLEKLADYFKVPITDFFEEDFLKVYEPPEKYNTRCPLCKEKDQVIDVLKDRIEDLKEKCSEKDELLDWYKGKKETAPDDSPQHRQSANE